MGFSLDDESLIHFILASIGSFPEDVPQIWPAYIGFSFSTLISKNYGLCCIPSQGFGESRTLDSCLDRGSSGTRAQCARRRRWSTHRTHREFVGSGSATVGVRHTVTDIVTLVLEVCVRVIGMVIDGICHGWRH